MIDVKHSLILVAVMAVVIAFLRFSPFIAFVIASL